MKIPLDFFLIIIKKFLEEAGLDDVTKILKKHLEITQEEFDKLIGDKKADLCIKKILKFYFKQNKDLKKEIKKIKKLILAQEEKHEQECEEASAQEQEAEKETQKQKKAKKAEKALIKEQVKSNGVENNETKLLAKKTQRKTATEDSEEEEYNFQFKKPIVKEEKKIGPNQPFKRISEEVINTLDDKFKDNSYETFMMQSGNQYGKEANDKLKIVRGKDFRKEKTKFKNKSSAGGFSISTEVKSIKLDLDSD